MAKANEIRLAVLDGDGIGPEITAATLSVLNAASKRTGLSVRTKRALIGWKAYEKTKCTLPDATRKVLDAHEGWIVGPTFAGEYPKDDPMRGHPNGFIRRHYKLFANVRPVDAWPQLHPPVRQRGRGRRREGRNPHRHQRPARPADHSGRILAPAAC